MGKTNTNWDQKYLEAVKTELADFETQGIKPTFRGMFYTLIDSYGLEKSQAQYKALNNVSVRWRNTGLIPSNAFADHTRAIIKQFDDDYEKPSEYVKRLIGYLKDAHNRYSIPKWYEQPNYVEIWLEKDAAVGTFQSMVESEELEVVVAPCRGHSSYEFFRSNIERLKRKLYEGKIVYVDYYGDLDPSGEVMDLVYRRKLNELGLSEIAKNFKRMAVTESQKDRFDLLQAPLTESEKNEMRKNDTNARSFEDRHGDLFQIQLEAMQTKNVRHYLKRLVVDSIRDKFDDAIYNEVMSRKKHKPKSIIGLVRKEIKALELFII